MTTSIQDLMGRASKVSTLNGPLVSDIGETLALPEAAISATTGAIRGTISYLM